MLAVAETGKKKEVFTMDKKKTSEERTFFFPSPCLQGFASQLVTSFGVGGRVHGRVTAWTLQISEGVAVRTWLSFDIGSSLNRSYIAHFFTFQSPSTSFSSSRLFPQRSSPFFFVCDVDGNHHQLPLPLPLQAKEIGNSAVVFV